MRYLSLTILTLFCSSFTVNAQHSELLLRHYRQAEAFANQQRFDEALHEYQIVIELDPRLPQAYLGLGNIYLAKLKFDLALETYTQAIALKLQSPEIYCNRGIIYTKQGEYDKAITDFQQALAIDTSYTPARFELGFVYQQIGEYEKATKEYERVLPQRRGDLALHHNLARCYFRLGQVEAAEHQHEIARQIRDLQDALDTAQQKVHENPEDPAGYMALAEIYAEHNQQEKAFEQYKAAILKDASLMEAYDKIAVLYIQNQQNKMAVTVYKTAVGVNPEYIKGHLMLGLLYQQSDELEESARHLETARQLAQKATETTPNVPSLNMLGAVYLALKDYNRAEATFQEALKLAPDNKQAQEYLHQVRQAKKSSSQPSAAGTQ